jgi:CheY-like chemotaxis protein
MSLAAQTAPTVIVVEDEILFQELVGPALEETGYSVLFASSGDSMRANAG